MITSISNLTGRIKQRHKRKRIAYQVKQVRNIIDNLPNKYALLTAEENKKVLEVLEPEYLTWLDALYGGERLTGDQLVYFIGLLIEDREKCVKNLTD